jgi:hypothetical protein
VDKESVERPLLVERIELLTRVLRNRVVGAGILLFNRGLYVEQAEAIYTTFPSVTRLLFLLGFDKIVQIFDPHYYQDRDASLRTLFSMAELLVAPRGNDGEQELQALLHTPENRVFAQYVHSLPFDSQYRTISSSEVRAGATGSRQAIPDEVRKFMRATHAYDSPVRLPDGRVHDEYAEHMNALEALLKKE